MNELGASHEYRIVGTSRKSLLGPAVCLSIVLIDSAYGTLRTNDPDYDLLWGLHNTGQHIEFDLLGGVEVNVDCVPDADIDAEEAWSITEGSISVLVAVIDTGIDVGHPDLEDNLLPGWNTIENSSDTDPDLAENADHGTKVAGIIAAVGDNAEGIIGVAPLVKLVPYKAVAPGGGQTIEDHVVAALDSCIQRPVDVINISHRFENDQGQYFVEVEQKLEEALSAGIVVVCSAGNDNDEHVFFTASMQGTIAVGASTMCDERKSPTSCDGDQAGFVGSNFGPELDLMAPGTAIRTTDPWIWSAYDWFWGTSSAAPFVSGAAALLRSIDATLSPGEVKTILCNTADQAGTYVYDPLTGKNPEMGHGRLNAYHAVLIGHGSGDPTVYLHAYASISDGGSNPERPLSEVTQAEFTAEPLYEQQSFSNGAILRRTYENQAYWLGQGIWDAYVSANGGDPLCLVGFPQSSEYSDSLYRRVDCEYGYIWWDGIDAHVEVDATLSIDYPISTTVWCNALLCGDEVGELYDVTWMAENVACEIKLDLLLDGQFAASLVECGSDPADAGIVNVFLPREDWQGQELEGSDLYQLHLQACNGTAESLSEPFSIKMLEIETPGVLHQGEEFTATWNRSENMHDPVSIQLVDECQWAPILAVGVPVENGSVQCTVPHDLPPGDMYRLRIYNTGVESVWDFSDGAFNIFESPADCRPAPVIDLDISIAADQAVLQWTAPDTTMSGDPIEIFGFSVYAAPEPFFSPEPQHLVGSTTQPDFQYQLNYETQPVLFFSVVTAGDCASQDPDMVLVPAGTFIMGQDGVAEPEHQVTLTRDFNIGTCEITNQQYVDALQWAFDQGHVSATAGSVQAYGEELLDLDAVYCEIAFTDGTFAITESESSYAQNAYPDGYDPASHPVKEVTWYGAACYCDWRSQIAGLQPFYLGEWTQTEEHNPYTAPGFRLPTEAEWEYAARYNDGRIYPWGNLLPDCNTANFRPGSYCIGWTTPVGSYPLGISELGLYDMAGNIREWCGDWYYIYSGEAQIDPLGHPSPTNGIWRGGSFYNEADDLRSAYRGISYMTYSNYRMGFRVCRTSNP